MKYVISIIVGAVIGYFTNWLAIKMLFKPREEKRILGFKVPFTPGLIPKERYRISRSVGEAIGEHLITEDTLIKSLKKKEVKEAVKKEILNKFKTLFNSNKKIKVLLHDIFKGKEQEIIQKFSNSINDSLISYARRDEFRDAIYLGIKSESQVFIKRPIYDYLKESDRMHIKATMNEEVYRYMDSKKVEEYIKEYLIKVINKKIQKNESLDSIVSQKSIDMIKNYIYNHRDEIVAEIEKFLQKEDMEKEIKTILYDAVKTKLNPMVAMFINVDTLYEKAIPIIMENLEKEKAKIAIISFINKQIDKFAKKEISEIVEEFSKEDGEDLINNIVSLLSNELLTKDLVKEIINLIEIKLKEDRVTFEDLLNMIKFNGKDTFDKVYKKLVSSKNLDSTIAPTLQSLIAELLNKNLNEIIPENAGNMHLTELDAWIDNIYGNLFKVESKNIFKALNISSMVEEKINELDVEFTEKIVLDIASKELNAITWLGALLGGIIGILTPIINNIM